MAAAAGAPAAVEGVVPAGATTGGAAGSVAGAVGAKPGAGAVAAGSVGAAPVAGTVVAGVPTAGGGAVWLNEVSAKVREQSVAVSNVFIDVEGRVYLPARFIRRVVASYPQ